MFSGNPDPAQDLFLLLQKKRSQPHINCEVVSDSARWLKSQLKGAGIAFTYLSCDQQDFYGYAVFLISLSQETLHSTLEVRIIEIDERAHAFCQIKVVATTGGDAFSYFTEIADEKGRQALMAYMADFLLSSGSGA